MSTKTKDQTPSEKVGRKYRMTQYGAHTRILDDREHPGRWYGRSNYPTEEEARTALGVMRRLSKSSVANIGGGMTMSFPPDFTKREFRLVKLDVKGEVLDVFQD